MMAATLFAEPVKKSKPIAKKLAPDPLVKAMKNLGLTSPLHALLCVPPSFDDYRTTHDSLAGLPEGTKGLFWLRRTGEMTAKDANGREVSPHPYDSLLEAPYMSHWRHVRKLTLTLECVTGCTAYITFFGGWRLLDPDPKGMILIRGEMAYYGRRLHLNGSADMPPAARGRLWPRYTAEGTQARESAVRELVERALADPSSVDACIAQMVAFSLLAPSELLVIAQRAAGWPFTDLRELLMALHRPESLEQSSAAQVAARALSVAGIQHAAQVQNTRLPHPHSALAVNREAVDRAIASQAETLTQDQRETIEVVCEGLRSPRAINVLMSGDVGTGKTLTYLIPSVVAQASGARVAIISPTEILADQVYVNLKRRFPETPVERVRAGGKLLSPGAILVGTAGLASVAAKCNYIPNILVVDEQHKLSSVTRDALLGPFTHRIEASATPIPRSVAAAFFGGRQVLTLRQAPVERAIESHVCDEADRQRLSAWLRETVAAGMRVAVVYPRIDKGVGESGVIGGVMQAAAALERAFPGQVASLHGKLTTGEIDSVLDSYRNGERRVLVASTIMETGIDIPDIRLLVVRQPDRMGAAGLHQLRGRLARNGGAARFVMMVDGNRSDFEPTTLARLDMVARTTNGFEIAESDMNSRGFGDLSGTAQTGAMQGMFTNLPLRVADFEAAVQVDASVPAPKMWLGRSTRKCDS